MGACASKSTKNAATPEAPAAPAVSPKPQEPAGDNTSDNTRVPSDSSNGFHTVLKIVEGVLIGFLGESLPKVLELLTDADMVIDDFKAVVEAYQQGDAVKALGLLGDTLKAIPQLVEDAGGAKEQAERFVAALAVLNDPKKIIFHVGEELLVNGKDVLARIEAAVAAWKASDWKKFGEEIGAIIGEITVAAAGSKAAEASASASEARSPENKTSA